MLPEQSKLLKIGQHVATGKGSDTLRGTVISISHSGGVQVKWDDGKISNHRHGEMQHIRLTQ